MADGPTEDDVKRTLMVEWLVNCPEDIKAESISDQEDLRLLEQLRLDIEKQIKYAEYIEADQVVWDYLERHYDMMRAYYANRAKDRERAQRREAVINEITAILKERQASLGGNLFSS